MGGQQFGQGGLLVDLRGLNRVLSLDDTTGVVEVEAGITWTELQGDLARTRADSGFGWAIAQKQTGADELTLGGAVAANIHGRGLDMRPFISDVESLELVNAEGRILTCSREENADLFRLVFGGYGLFGIVCSLRLRLVPRHKVRRVVDAMPPIIGRAIRRITSDPNPSVMKMGASPAMTVMTVMSLGRTRKAAPCITLCNSACFEPGLSCLTC